MENKDILKRTIIITFFVILVDQITKFLVTNLIRENSVTIISGFIAFSKAKNTGIAFSLNEGNLKNIIISLAIIILIVNYLFKQKKYLNIFTLTSLDFIIAGGLSNLIDRIFKGGIVDFIEIVDFPIFNLADCCIVLGWCFFAFYIIKFEVKKKK